MKSLSKILVAVFALFFALSSAYAQTRGIDVSRHQKNIDWEKVAADNVQFVYIKATEGATYQDPMFKKNIEGAQKAGLLVGVYHFFRMTSTPEEQFENFKRAMKGYKMDLVPMIDVEPTDKEMKGKSVKDLQKNLDKFIALVKAEYGVPPMIYGTQRSYNTYCAPKYNNYHLYIGRYGKNSPEIIGKGTYTIWQYTENGKVNGITEDVDICKFNSKYGINDIMIKKSSQVLGIDVSRHQKTIDWEKVAADSVQFVYVKVSEGATYRDPMYKKNIEGAQKEGILVGAYHYFRMTSTPEEQFENFKKAMKDYKMDLVPMIDVEPSQKEMVGKSVKDLQKNLDKFIALIKDEYGVPPMIYGTQRSYNTYCAPKYNKYHLYIGRYGSHSPEIIGKGTYTIWQYTETGKINGIPVAVDICKFNPKYGIKDIMIKK